MKKYCMFVCIVMIVDAALVDASTMDVVNIFTACNNYQEVSSQLNVHSLNDLLSHNDIGSGILAFLDENTEEISAEKTSMPSFMLAEQENFMHSVQNSNFIQFIDAWTILNFYISNFPQLQKYSKFCNDKKQTPLHIAIRNSLNYSDKELQKMHDSAKSLILRRLLQKNSIIDVHAQDTTGATAIHYAAQRHNVLVIKMLKKAGGNVNAQDEKGDYPLHYVIAGSDSSNARKTINTIETLVFLGARINAKNNEAYREKYQDYIGMTPLVYADRMRVQSEVISTLCNLGGK